jgi:hypothetical protein
MKEVTKTAMTVQTKADFLEFLKLLIEDFKNNRNSWTNDNLNDYLNGIQGWIEDMEGYYINTKTDLPKNINWKIFADILIAAKMYE